MTNKIGQKIKQFREEKKLSIAELAAETALLAQQVEMIESGEIKPSMATLIRIAQVLKLRPGTILDGEECNAPAVHYHKKELVPTASVSNNNTEVRKHMDFFALAQEKSDRTMEPLLVNVNYVDPESIPASQHEGEEFIYVLSGTAVLAYGEESYVLEAGDSVYYDSFVPHVVTTPSPGEKAQVLAIIYTPF